MELIKIQEKNGQNLVSARDLHAFLEVETKFADWIYRQIDRAMLLENTDFLKIIEASQKWEGSRTVSREQIEFYLTIQAAKEIGMLNGGTKGKEARLYFIQCEKELKEAQPKQLSNLEIFELAVANEKKLIALQATIDSQKDDVEFAQQLKDTTNSISFATAAKAMNLGFGQNILFQKCRELKLINKLNRPYQVYVNAGYFVVVETSYVHPKTGDRMISVKTQITGKGQEFILKKLKELRCKETNYVDNATFRMELYLD